MSTRKHAARPVAPPTDKTSARGRRAATSSSGPFMTVQTFFADEVAWLAATERRKVAAPKRCDVCDARVHGDDGGLGLFVWARGDELRAEEPALCEHCANTLGIAMLRKLDLEDEEG